VGTRDLGDDFMVALARDVSLLLLSIGSSFSTELGRFCGCLLLGAVFDKSGFDGNGDGDGVSDENGVGDGDGDGDDDCDDGIGDRTSFRLAELTFFCAGEREGGFRPLFPPFD